MADYCLYPEECEMRNNGLQKWVIDYRTRCTSSVARLVENIHKDLVDLCFYRACTSVPTMQNNWKIFKIHELDGLEMGNFSNGFGYF
ncbi:GL25792 [Drosophila persimilis]|uniref:GL25792 n=1 Tax=Drosophila persimilis TaxID=7234 RepID=B4GJW4_DROPE|nr:GL25792 [Drosophila persimilis]